MNFKITNYGNGESASVIAKDGRQAIKKSGLELKANDRITTDNGAEVTTYKVTTDGRLLYQSEYRYK